MKSKSQPCAALIPLSSIETDGLVQVEVDPVAGQLILTYDSQRLAAGEAERLARALAAALTERPAHCTLHVRGPDGRSCEACALALERRLQAWPGVQKARVSF